MTISYDSTTDSVKVTNPGADTKYTWEYSADNSTWGTLQNNAYSVNGDVMRNDRYRGYYVRARDTPESTSDPILYGLSLIHI